MSYRKAKALLIDALGTIVRLEPPPWRLLGPRIGLAPGDERLVSAFGAEMAYYREHAHEGRDEASLADLRRRCAVVLSRELGLEVAADQMMEAIRFEAFADAAPTLRELRRRGLRIVCVSNWDCSLGSVLERCGLGELLDGVVTSAEAGASKPERRIFEAALTVAGCSAAEALHVGDTPEEDGAGARAAGVRALILDREGSSGDISGLGELLDPARIVAA